MIYLSKKKRNILTYSKNGSEYENLWRTNWFLDFFGYKMWPESTTTADLEAHGWQSQQRQPEAVFGDRERLAVEPVERFFVTWLIDQYEGFLKLRIPTCMIWGPPILGNSMLRTPDYVPVPMEKRICQINRGNPCPSIRRRYHSSSPLFGFNYTASVSL